MRVEMANSFLRADQQVLVLLRELQKQAKEDWRGNLWSVGEGKLLRRLPVLTSPPTRSTPTRPQVGSLKVPSAKAGLSIW